MSGTRRTTSRNTLRNSKSSNCISFRPFSCHLCVIYSSFPDKRFQCDFCKKRFQKSAQLRDHRIKQHNIKTHSYNTKGRGAQKSTSKFIPNSCSESSYTKCYSNHVDPKVPVARKKAGKPKPQPKQASRPRQTKVYDLRERDLPMVHEPSPSPEDIVAAERHAEAAEALFLLKMGATVPA